MKTPHLLLLACTIIGVSVLVITSRRGSDRVSSVGVFIPRSNDMPPIPDANPNAATDPGSNTVPVPDKFARGDVSFSSDPRFAQFASGRQLRENGLANTVLWLSEADVAGVDFKKIRSKASNLMNSPEKTKAIGSREEAVAHLEVNLSMAERPTAAYEDNEFFYFSGGTTAYPVRDFSRGLMVSKATGQIREW